MIEFALFIAGIVVAVLGWIGKRMYDRWRSLSQEVDETSTKVDTLWKWAFGRVDDETDSGLAEEVDNGFQKIEDNIEEVKRRQETYHDAEMAQFRQLVNELHDEEELDFDRDDVFDDD